MKILSQKENPLYNRRELVVEIESSKGGTTGRKEAVKEIAAETGVAGELIIIDEIRQQFGNNTCRVTAKAYANAEALKKFEPAYKKQRDLGEKAAKKEEKVK
jgi:ribosomal protein S24E